MSNTIIATLDRGGIKIKKCSNSFSLALDWKEIVIRLTLSNVHTSLKEKLVTVLENFKENEELQGPSLLKFPPPPISRLHDTNPI